MSRFSFQKRALADPNPAPRVWFDVEVHNSLRGSFERYGSFRDEQRALSELRKTGRTGRVIRIEVIRTIP